MRIIGHIDLDAFFASVEERDHEWFRGRPLIVGADPKEGRGRGVVSTANYKARKYGVHSALPISQAWRLCKAAEVHGSDPCVFAALDFKNYSATSERIMEIVRQYSGIVEVASIDEAYFYLTLSGSFAEAGRICQKLKEEIFGTDTLNSAIILERFRELISEVFRRFKNEGFNSFKTVAVKVRFLDFETKTSVRTFLHLLGSENTLYFESVKLLIPYLDRRKNPRQKPIRLVGLRIEKLRSEQPALFSA